MREEMARFADFSNQRSRVELLCESLGHVCLFLPKFHPELNPIELNWRDSKNELRRNCTCSSVGFKQRWHAALDAMTPEMIREGALTKYIAPANLPSEYGGSSKVALGQSETDKKQRRMVQSLTKAASKKGRRKR